MPVLNTQIRILGCGNLLMGNDGIGLKVVEALKKTELKELEGLEILDAGVCGLDLLNLLDGVRKVIIVDAILVGGFQVIFTTSQAGRLSKIPSLQCSFQCMIWGFPRC